MLGQVLVDKRNWQLSELKQELRRTVMERDRANREVLFMKGVVFEMQLKMKALANKLESVEGRSPITAGDSVTAESGLETGSGSMDESGNPVDCVSLEGSNPSSSGRKTKRKSRARKALQELELNSGLRPVAVHDELA